MNAAAESLIVLSAPSGAGKTTLVRALMERDPRLCFSVSYTTRPRRPGEVHGRDYFFIDEKEFFRMRDRGAFLEHARVFGNWYGTAREHVCDLIDSGKRALLEIDWQGARQVRAGMPGCRSIFILPPSLAELERRLRNRCTDAEDVIAHRLGEAVDDIAHWDEFEFVVINDDLERAIATMQAIIDGEDPGRQATAERMRERVGMLFPVLN